TSVAVKKVNDVTRLQALVDKKKVVITKASIRDALCLDDAEGVEYLPNKEIFTELARMCYEKPSTRLTFYKAFFLSQWKCCCDDVNAAVDEPSIPSPPPPTPPPQPSQDIPSTSQDAGISMDLIQNLMDIYEDVVLEGAKNVAVEKFADVQESADDQGRKAESQAEIYKIDLEHAKKVLNLQEEESEPAELQEVVEVVTTAKIITEFVTAATDTITAADVPILAAIIDRKPQTEAQAMKNMMIYLRNVVGFKMDYFKETTTTSTIIHSEAKSKYKGKGILAEEPKPLKKQAQIKQDEKYARELEIVPNDEDDVYTEVTPLARKIPVVDYKIYNENKKPYYKIKRADEEESEVSLELLSNYEYLVKISKMARILELKRRNMKIIVLTSNTPYPSRKIRHIYACTSQETTKEKIQYAVSRRLLYVISKI
nr:hypothetical protein [Tanacetum cinerariifolium]